MVSTKVIVPEASVESSASGVHWGAIFAGAVGAVGVTIILVSLGPGLGPATVSPWTPSSTPPATFGIAAGIWLIITQWLSAGLGGYLTGRLREKWMGVRTDEVLFRDTAHRFGGGWGCGGSDPCASRSSFTRSCRGGSKGSDQLLFL
jgi:hypothetical protein